MVELLQFVQAGLAVTAVTLAAVTLPVVVVTDAEMPDLQPLIEQISEKDAHGFCGQKEWVKDLVRFKENNAY